MTNWNIKEILKFLKEAGNIALDIQKRDEWDFKEDHSLVTEADKTIEDMARKRFISEGAYFIGEETILTDSEEDIQNAIKGPTWILDPVDGTAPFANGLPTWGVSLGFMEEGKLTEGAIAFPGLDLTVYTNEGTTYIIEGDQEPRPLTVSTSDFNEGRMLCIPQDVTKWGVFTGDTPVQVTGSCVYSMLQLLLGRYSSYFSRAKVWDIGAGWPILRTAGVKAYFYNGEETDLLLEPKDFVLDVDSPKRWRTQYHVIYANNEQARAYMNEHIKLKDEV
ncbi:inositol monophosphatase family protein [Spirochaeta cellobiosiphila]|uniref:inositol monophosphatase family protein n=1 Tax=Spirochaeta cellobiosiphila TaxID=504483 RepID=UPI00041AC84C|nr:inositol monophosphatase family protein [Spirochaeta cellobiosiphila]